MIAAFALAFTAGLVATVNPCGIAMLPAYLSYFVGVDDGPAVDRPTTVLRAMKVGAIVSAGFIAVFGLTGVLVSLGIQQVVDVIPWAALVVGAGIVALGTAMLFGYELTIGLPTVDRGTDSRHAGAMFVFGVSYAVASLSCTLPVFLVVVAGTIPTLSVIGGVAVFLVYGLGMSLVLLVLTLAVASGRRAFVSRIRGSARRINRVAGGVLVAAGAYVVFFWATNLSRGPLRPGALAVRVEQLSSRATDLIGSAPLLWGSIAAVLVVIAVAYAWWASQEARSPRG